MKLIALNPRKKAAKKRPAKKKAAKRKAAKKPAGRKPAKKKAVKRTAKAKGANMAKRKKTTRRRPARKNPSARRTVRRARRAVGMLGPVEGAAKSMLPMFAGMLSAKVVQRKFGGGKSELENWEWKDYLMGALGTAGASVLSKSVLKLSAAQQQKVLEGGMFFLLSKALLTELVPMSDTAKEWLGEDGRTWRAGDRYVNQGTGETFVLGENGEWYDQTNVRGIGGGYDEPRLVGAAIEDEDNEVMLGEGMTPVTALGEGMTPVTALGGLPAYPQGIF